MLDLLNVLLFKTFQCPKTVVITSGSKALIILLGSVSSLFSVFVLLSFQLIYLCSHTIPRVVLCLLLSSLGSHKEHTTWCVGIRKLHAAARHDYQRSNSPPFSMRKPKSKHGSLTSASWQAKAVSFEDLASSECTHESPACCSSTRFGTILCNFQPIGRIQPVPRLLALLIIPYCFDSTKLMHPFWMSIGEHYDHIGLAFCCVFA